MLKNVPGHGITFKVLNVNFIPFLALTDPALATADLVHMAATQLSQSIQCHMFVLGKKGDGDRKMHCTCMDPPVKEEARSNRRGRREGKII